ncbi:hypothetical protein D3C72_2272310 [compost metagenome]
MYGYRDTDVGKAHGDAPPDGAGSDDRDLFDVAKRDACFDTRDCSRFSLGEEHMT